MLISIIICTYNADNKLRKTLNSILPQKSNDFEVIIIDGKSEDGTIDIIKMYEKKFKGKLKWISEKDSGIYEAINKGIRIAKGKYLNIVGAGDWQEENVLKSVIGQINKNPEIDAIQGTLRIWDKELNNNYLLKTYPYMLLYEPMQHPALFYKKELHDIYGLYDEKYKIVADYLFCMRAFFLGKSSVSDLDSVVDNYITEGISSTNIVLCNNENKRARLEIKNTYKNSNLLPLVSIIVPSYNQDRYILETLNSILSQQYENWECIIVDDGSTDNTEIIVKDFIRNNNDKRFKYFKQERSGVSTARNNGIKKSSGIYTLPLDSDDKISPNYIIEAVMIFGNNKNIKLVYSEANFFGLKSGKWELPKYSYNDLLFGNMIFCSAFYRKEDFDKTNGYNSNMEKGYEDWDFWVSFLNEEDLVYRIPKVHFFYRIKKKSRNNDLDNSKEDLDKMTKQIFLNNLDKYMRLINPIHMENETRGLRDFYNNVITNKELRFLNKDKKLFTIDNLKKSLFILKKEGLKPLIYKIKKNFKK